MADEKNKVECLPVTQVYVKTLLSVLRGKLEKDAAAFLLLLSILASVLGVGIKVGSVIDTLSVHEKQIDSLVDSNAGIKVQLNQIQRSTDIVCAKFGCDLYGTPRRPQDLDSGTATTAPPAPHSKLTPPGTLALKERPAPISFNQPNY